jgi:hypothetical protein
MGAVDDSSQWIANSRGAIRTALSFGRAVSESTVYPCYDIDYNRKNQG